jgi:hypothetical protein
MLQQCICTIGYNGVRGDSGRGGVSSRASACRSQTLRRARQSRLCFWPWRTQTRPPFVWLYESRYLGTKEHRDHRCDHNNNNDNDNENVDRHNYSNNLNHVRQVADGNAALSEAVQKFYRDRRARELVTALETGAAGRFGGNTTYRKRVISQ